MQAGATPGAGTDQAAVLAAMLRIAEGEIRAKDEQHSLLQQIIAQNEKQLATKDARIAELEAKVVAMQLESEQFKGLFDKYLAMAEAARTNSAYQQGAAAMTTAGMSSLSAASAGSGGGGSGGDDVSGGSSSSSMAPSGSPPLPSSSPPPRSPPPPSAAALAGPVGSGCSSSGSQFILGAPPDEGALPPPPSSPPPSFEPPPSPKQSILLPSARAAEALGVGSPPRAAAPHASLLPTLGSPDPEGVLVDGEDADDSPDSLM